VRIIFDITPYESKLQPVVISDQRNNKAAGELQIA